MLTAGQKLWYVPAYRHGGDPREVVVNKVGRKWASLDDGRVERLSVDTLVVDGKGYTSPGRCYLTRGEWEEECRREHAWVKLQRFVRDRYSPPSAVSRDAIEQAAKLLSVEISD